MTPWILLFLLLGAVSALDIRVSDGEGFFVKYRRPATKYRLISSPLSRPSIGGAPSYGLRRTATQRSQSGLPSNQPPPALFVLSQTSATRVEVRAGPHLPAATANITDPAWKFGLGGGSERTPTSPGGHLGEPSGLVSAAADESATARPYVLQTSEGARVTAHAVRRVISSANPTLEVFIHADRPFTRPRCFNVFAERTKGEVQKATCAVPAGRATCFVKVALPFNRWSWLSGSVQVYFSLVGDETSPGSTPSSSEGTDSDSRDYLDECRITSNNIHMSVYGAETKYEVGRVALVPEVQKAYDETIDGDVTVERPSESMKLGSRFNVAVKLAPGADVGQLQLKIKPRGGLILTDVRSVDTSMWRVSLHPSKEGSHLVIASLIKPHSTGPVQKSQTVFSCKFLVDPTASDKSKRIRWVLVFKQTISGDSVILEDGKPHVTRIAMVKENAETLVVVRKTTDLVNTLAFDQSKPAVPLWVYHISEWGEISAVPDLRCHSTDETILKVKKDCTGVYFDGSCRLAGHVSIEVTNGAEKEFVDFRVWLPDETAVTLKFSDDVLEEIREWKSSSPDLPSACSPQHQTAKVQIFTRFYTVGEGGRDIYMGDNKEVTVFVDVTDMLAGSIRTTKPRVVTFEGGVLRGHRRGNAEVQVFTSRGVLAVKEIKVTHGKPVSLDKILVHPTSGLKVTLQKVDNTRILEAYIERESLLTKKGQRASLEIHLKFTDGRVVPLSQFPPSQYSIKVLSENRRAVKVIPADDITVGVSPITATNTSMSASKSFPQVEAVSSGESLITVAIYSSPHCDPGSLRPVVTAQAVVRVDIRAEPRMVIDYSDSNRPSGRVFFTARARSRDRGDQRGVESGEAKKSAVDASSADDSPASSSKEELLNDGVYRSNTRLIKEQGHGTGVAFGIPGDSGKGRNKGSNNDKVSINGATGASAQGASLDGHQADVGLTPLEIAVYSVSGILCLIGSIMFTNCLVYVYRQRVARAAGSGKIGGVGPTSQEGPSNGWVWVGGATLERHSVSTKCSKIMPERQFRRSNGGGGTGASIKSTVSLGTYKGSECSVRITNNLQNTDASTAAGGGRVERALSKRERMILRSAARRPIISPDYATTEDELGFSGDEVMESGVRRRFDPRSYDNHGDYEASDTEYDGEYASDSEPIDPESEDLVWYNDGESGVYEGIGSAARRAAEFDNPPPYNPSGLYLPSPRMGDGQVSTGSYDEPRVGCFHSDPEDHLGMSSSFLSSSVERGKKRDRKCLRRSKSLSTDPPANLMTSTLFPSVHGIGEELTISGDITQTQFDHMVETFA